MPEQRPERIVLRARPQPPIARRQRPEASLPSGVAAAVPTCVQSCLSASVGQQFDTQCAATGLSCMCGKYSSQGFTLGELALSCAYVYCSDPGQDDEQQAYNVCSSVRDAVTATHTILTVAPAETTVQATVSRKSTAPLSTTTTSSISTNTFKATPSVSSIMTSTPTPPAVTSSPSTGLKATQVAGIAVGCIGGIALTAALIVCLLHCRRRRQARSGPERRNEKDGFDFIDRTPAQPSPHDFPCYQLSHQTYVRDGGPVFGSGTASPASNFPRAKVIPPAIAGIGIGGAMSSQRAGTPRTRNSQESTRTISQLLPDRPIATPPNSQERPQPTADEQWSREAKPASPPPSGQATNVNEMRTPRFHTDMAPQSMPPRTSSLRPPVNSRATRPIRPEEQRQPSLSLEIPRQPLRPVGFPPTQAYVARTQARPGRRSARPVATNAVQTHYAEFTTQNRGQKRGVEAADDSWLASPTSITPIDEDEQRRQAVPAAIVVTRPHENLRAVQTREYPRSKALNRRESTGSCTSFESGDEDEGQGRSDHQLSPVQEHSPISGLRYPIIPQSAHEYANSLTTGSPSQRLKIDVPPPLRVGRSPQHEAQHGEMRQTRAAHERYQAETGARDMSRTPMTQEVEVKTPLWEPKLTPSRGGDDLYLSVSPASPRY